MKKLLIILMLFIPSLSMSQTWVNFINDFGIDWKKHKESRGLVGLHVGDDLVYLRKVKSDVFKFIMLKYHNYNRDSIREAYLYFNKKSESNPNYQLVTKSLDSYYGSSFGRIDNNDGITYFYSDGKDLVNFKINRNKKSYIRFYPAVSNYSFNGKYDEFTKSTEYSSLNPPSFTFDNEGRTYVVSFAGNVNSGIGNIQIQIGYKGTDWIFMENIIFLSRGKTYTEPLKTTRDVVSGGIFEAVTAYIPNELVDQANSYEDIKIRVQGKFNYDLLFTPQMFSMFESLRKRVSDN